MRAAGGSLATMLAPAALISSSDRSRTAAALTQGLDGSGAAVADVVSARTTVSTASGLAATDLGGLARLELGFGVLLTLACSGLALLLGVAQRRRALVLLAALGASGRQRGRFLTAEAQGLLVGGLLGGAAVAAVVAYLVVKVLTGIFDPPPPSAAVPSGYLIVLTGAVLLSAFARAQLRDRRETTSTGRQTVRDTCSPTGDLADGCIGRRDTAALFHCHPYRVRVRLGSPLAPTPRPHDAHERAVSSHDQPAGANGISAGQATVCRLFVQVDKGPGSAS